MYREPDLLPIVLFILLLAGASGCKTVSQSPTDFSALTAQVSYQAPVVEKKPPPSGALGKVQAAALGTIRFVGGACVWVSCKMFESWLDDEDDEKGYDPNPLWHQGYGFNNPNNERIRNGQPVLNFDGSVAK